MDPKIETTDTADTGGADRPIEVSRAVQLGSVSLVIGGIRTVFDLAQKLTGVYFLVALLVMVVFLGIFFFLLRKIAAGRNWARIVFLVLFLIGLPLAIPGYLAELRTSLPRGLISLLIAILQLIATYLLFTKNSNLWFRTRK